MYPQAIFLGNWKMNFLEEDIISFFREFAHNHKNALVGFAVPAPYLKFASSMKQDANIQIGAQNCHWEQSGAFTGELSTAMLKDCGASFTLVGHSERRQYFGETNETVQRRTERVLKEGLVSVTCIGETKEQYQEGERTKVLSQQIKLGLKGVTEDNVKNLIVAYEPVWAIGTGLSATPEEADSAHRHIRKELISLFPDGGNKIPILYGGSVNSKNSKELLALESINGFLVGGASLKAGEFSALIENTIG